MHKCADCGSLDIVEVNLYQGYFREGDWVRRRTIQTWSNINQGTEVWYASCPELSLAHVSKAVTELLAIQSLKDMLKTKDGHPELLGNKIEE